MSSTDNMNICKKIAIGFVIYNPEDSLLDRIEIADNCGFTTYIFDNSPTKDIVRDFSKKLKNCKYATCGKNVGLGFGISFVCAQAYYESFPALVFFDQDTIFNLSTLEFIENFYTNNANLASAYSSIVFNSKKYDKEDVSNQLILKDVLLAISSGSLYFLENLKKINWHNESYFVDCVDYEFCLKSSNNNLKIAECSITPGFDHVTEQADTAYKIFGKEMMLRKYSPKRVLDTTFASLRLFFNSIITINILFARTIIRSLAIYLHFQLLVRLINVFNQKNG